MGLLQRLVDEHDIRFDEGWKAATMETPNVSEWELRYAASWRCEGNDKNSQMKILATAELDRRADAVQRRMVTQAAWISAGAGLVGVFVGALLSALLH